MKKKILAALCAICTCVTSYTAAFLPTALAENTVGTFITYEPLQTDHTDNVFYVSEDVVFTMRCTNTYGSNVTTKYTYTVTDANNNVITGPIASNNITLQAGKSGTRTITLSDLACGEYTLELQEESGTSNSNKQTLKFYAQFTVIEVPPTPSPVPGEEYITYETPYPEKGGSAYYSTEDVVYKVKVTNKLDQVVYGRYQYTLTKPDGTELPEVKQQGFSTLNAKASVTAAITIDVPEGVYGTYTLQLKYLSSLDKTIATTKTKIFDDITFTVSEPPATADLTKVTYEKLAADASHPGNVFFGSEPVVFAPTIANTNDYPVFVRYSYVVTDENDQVFISSSAPSKPQMAGANRSTEQTVELQAAKWKYGKYNIQMTAECATSEDASSFTTLRVLYTKFAVCIRLGESNVYENFGFNQALINPKSAINNQDKVEDAQALLPLIKNAGARWHREDVLWSGVETTEKQRTQNPGLTKYNDLTRYKERIRFMREKYNIETVCILKGTHDDYDEGGTPVSTGENGGRTAFAAFCAYVVGQLGDVVDHYEIWNEWNLKSFNPTEASDEDYAELLKESYNAIKAKQAYMNHNKPQGRTEDYNFTVIGCDSAGMPYGRGQFIDNVLQYFRDYNNGNYCMDAISIHCYDYNKDPDKIETKGKLGFPEELVEKKVNGLKGLLREYGLENLPIWVTEAGYNTANGTGKNEEGEDSSGCTEDEQLNAMVMFNVINRAHGWFDKVIQYQFSDRGIDRTDVRYNWGVTRNWEQDQYTTVQGGQGYPGDQTNSSYIPKDYPKKAYLGVSAMNYFIGGKSEYTNTKFEDTENRHYAYQFRNPTINKYVWVVIAGGLNNTPTATTLDLGFTDIDIYDKYGNFYQSRHSDDGHYALQVSTEPIYIVSGPKILVTKNGQQVTSGSSLKRGDTLTVSMTGMENHLKQATSPAMIVAQYDEKGKYIGSDMHKFSTQTDFSGTITVARFARKIKVIYWDMSGLKPLLDTYYIQ